MPEYFFSESFLNVFSSEKKCFYKEASVMCSPLLTKGCIIELFCIDASDDRSSDGILYSDFDQRNVKM